MRAANTRAVPGTEPSDEGRPLRIAMIGQRGLPATYGGIEHHVSHLGRRLAARGHEVTVYCRTNYVEERLDDFHGIRLRHLPTIGTKHLDAIVHSFTSSIAATAARPDIVHYHALGPGLCSPLPRLLSGAKVVQTVHGMDDRRAKWGAVAKNVLRTARWMSDRMPDALVAVSREVAEAYEQSRSGLTVHIPNGVERPGAAVRAAHDGSATPAPFGLTSGRYVLFVGRLVPEKAPGLLMEAFRGLPDDVELVFAGGTSYTGDFVDSLQALAGRDRRVRMLGYVYGPDLTALYANAALFVQPSSLEGMPLTLLEALSYGLPVVVSGIAPHYEVLEGDGPGARFFRTGDAGHLTEVLSAALADLHGERLAARRRVDQITSRFSWDIATDATERLYRSLLTGGSGGLLAGAESQDGPRPGRDHGRHDGTVRRAAAATGSPRYT